MKLIQKLSKTGVNPDNKGFGGILERKRKAEVIDRKVMEYERLEEFTGMKKIVLNAMFVPFDTKIEEYLNAHPQNGLELALGEFIDSIMLYDAVREDSSAGAKITRAKLIMGKTWEKVNKLVEECWTLQERKVLILYKEYQNFNLYIHDSDWIIYENEEDMDIDDEVNETSDFSLYFNNLGEVSEEIRDTILRETKYKYFFTEVEDTLCIVDSVFVDKVLIERTPINNVEQQVLQNLGNNRAQQQVSNQEQTSRPNTQDNTVSRRNLEDNNSETSQRTPTQDINGMITDLLNRRNIE